MFDESRTPEKILKDVEIYLSDAHVPNYAAVQALEKGIKAYPDNVQLKEKLKEIEDSNGNTASPNSPKTLYAILVVAIGLMGIGLLFSYFSDRASFLALALGISFLVGSLLIYNQYKKEL